MKRNYIGLRQYEKFAIVDRENIYLNRLENEVAIFVETINFPLKLQLFGNAQRIYNRIVLEI